MPLNRLNDSGQHLLPNEPDVQRTTLSLDALGRFVCNTWNEAVTLGSATTIGSRSAFCATGSNEAHGPWPNSPLGNGSKPAELKPPEAPNKSRRFGVHAGAPPTIRS